MPTSPLKRPSGGGDDRLRRLLASLRPTACAGPLPVQTGFPTSLADIVVKHHGRLKIPRRRRRAAVSPPAAAAEPASVSQQSRELSLPHDDAAAQVPAPGPARPRKGARGFSIRPGVLAAGGAVALALLVICCKQLVAAATLASVALSWIESARTIRARRGHVSPSPIREAAESRSPRSDGGGRDAASLWSIDDGTSDVGCGDASSSVGNPKRKQSRRSLRKLLAGKLRSGKTPRGTESRHGGDAGEHERELPETPRRVKSEPGAARGEATLPEAITDDERCQSRRQRGGAIPLPALVPIILAGLVAGKLPSLALAVLCAAFSSSVERLPVPDNCDAIPR